MSEKNPPIPLNDEATDEIVTLTDEEGQDHEFVLVDVLELNEREYAILLPFDDVTEGSDKEDAVDEEEMEAVILRIEKDANGEEQLAEIEDEQEWQSVVDAYEAMLDEGDDEDGQ
jgi:putative Holliday junction resolvase